jgi:protein-tyrosine phosphatase
MRGIAEILPGVLYVGRGLSPREARKRGMKHVLNVARRKFGPGRVKHFPLVDGAEDPARLLEAAFKVKRRVDSGRVPLYVHCAAGKSRSPTVCALYLVIAGKKRTFLSALEFVKARREVADPNERIMRAAAQALLIWKKM